MWFFMLHTILWNISKFQNQGNTNWRLICNPTYACVCEYLFWNESFPLNFQYDIYLSYVRPRRVQFYFWKCVIYYIFWSKESRDRKKLRSVFFIYIINVNLQYGGNQSSSKYHKHPTTGIWAHMIIYQGLCRNNSTSDFLSNPVICMFTHIIRFKTKQIWCLQIEYDIRITFMYNAPGLHGR